MSLDSVYSSDQLRDYSSLFSRRCVLEWLSGNLSSINFKIDRYDQVWLNNKKNRYIDYLKYVYGILENQYQNEYIVKNAFLNDWLIQELGKNDSQIFSEFRIGKVIADLVMFNGRSKVFEIKTELDSNRRLNTQLEEYQKVFNDVYLIVPSKKYDEYSECGDGIGIITFDGDKNERFNLRIQANTNFDIDIKTLMQVFHTTEYKQVVTNYYGQLPTMTSFNQFEVCHDLIKNIPQKELNQLFIGQMKLRSKAQKLSNRCYKEFNQISLALKMKNENWKHLFSVLKSPINA